MAESRRGLITKGIAAGALLVAAGVIPVAMRRTKLRPTPVGRKLQFFTPQEYSIWAAVAERVLATDVTDATREPDGARAEAALSGEPRPAAPTPVEVDVAGKVD